MGKAKSACLKTRELPECCAITGLNRFSSISPEDVKVVSYTLGMSRLGRVVSSLDGIAAGRRFQLG